MSFQNDQLHLIPWQLPAEPPAGLSLVERVLVARGYSDARTRLEFLNPAALDPFVFRDMATVVARLHAVVNAGGHILVFGDYDADGLTATAIMVRFLRHLGASVASLIPDRLEEGYGLAASHVEAIIAAAPDLLLTVDCGSNNAAEVQRLYEAGIAVIVTDHHVIEDDAVMAVAHLNPHAEPALNDLLAGAGVAYMVVEAYCARYPVPDAHALLARLQTLAMVGTIADIMPLIGANRALVSAALHRFHDHAPAGLKALLAERGGAVDAQAIAYAIGPQLNAASRVGSVAVALDILLTDDEAEAGRLAGKLRQLNEKRKKLESEISEAAIEQAYALGPVPVIVVRDANWHAGVLGIVAARLVERFQKPAIVLSRDGDAWQGSARSLPGLNIHGALQRVSASLLQFGGHQRAAGLAIHDDTYDAFLAALLEETQSWASITLPHTVDVQLTAADLYEMPLRSLDLLEPCGEANPKTQAAILQGQIVAIRSLGAGKHTAFDLAVDEQICSCIWFGCASLADFYTTGDIVDVLGQPSWHVFRNKGKAQLIVKDMRPSLPPLSSVDEPPYPPERFIKVYRMLVRYAKGHSVTLSPLLFAKRLTRAYNDLYTRFMVLDALTVLAEARVLEMVEEDANLRITLATDPPRAALSQTATWQRLVQEGRLLSND